MLFSLSFFILVILALLVFLLLLLLFFIIFIGTLLLILLLLLLLVFLLPQSVRHGSGGDGCGVRQLSSHKKDGPGQPAQEGAHHHRDKCGLWRRGRRRKVVYHGC